jgi:two-component system phosphate regulon response regulator PhoB
MSGHETKAVILVVEDDPEIQELLSFSLTKEGWKLLRAESGERGLEILKEGEVDCILLDLMLPGMDGFKFLKKIQEDGRTRHVPVIMTTARGEEADVVSGLELGADDYVVKPYSPRVLAARIRAALRRQEESGQEESLIWRRGTILLNEGRHEAFCGERELDLQATEFALLRHFLSHPGIVFSRNQIISALKGPDYPVTDRSVDVQILGLRKKLGEAGEMIETIRGVGYRFRSPE